MMKPTLLLTVLIVHPAIIFGAHIPYDGSRGSLQHLSLNREAELESRLRAIENDVQGLSFGAPWQQEESLISDEDLAYNNREISNTEEAFNAEFPMLQPEPEDVRDGDLFEGDLNIPMEMIKKYYDLDSIPAESQQLLFKGRNVRHTAHAAAAGAKLKLWINGVVPYVIGGDVSSKTRQAALDSMKHIEENTCIRFVQRKTENDYVFITSANDGCYSYVGRTGGKQVLNLGVGCGYISVVTHELMHALGFWHEQSRPDRDDYVKIVTENVDQTQMHNFLKLKASEVNSRGVPYDYGSVMHYSQTAFRDRTRCARGHCRTIEVINDEVYKAQGRPELGSAERLSPRDIQQLQLLYKCAAPVPDENGGTLKVFVRYARNLRNTDSRLAIPWIRIADPYVRVSALDVNGQKYQKDTKYIRETLNPNWNEWIDLGHHSWQSSVTLQIFDFDGPIGDGDKMSDPQSLPIKPGRQSQLKINGYQGTLTVDILFTKDL